MGLLVRHKTIGKILKNEKVAKEARRKLCKNWQRQKRGEKRDDSGKVGKGPPKQKPGWTKKKVQVVRARYSCAQDST